jgi:hypothetical protein
LTLQTGAVIDDATNWAVGERRRESGHCRFPRDESVVHPGKTHADGIVFCLRQGEFELRASFGDDEFVDRGDASLKADAEMEATGEHRDDHRLELCVREFAGRHTICSENFGLDIE